MNTVESTIQNSVKHWYLPLIAGIIFIAAGIYSFSVPAAVYATLTVFFIYSFVISGILEIAFALINSKELKGWGWYLVNGIIELVIGCVLASNPLLAAGTLPYFIGFIVLFRSTMLLGFAFELKHSGLLIFIGILGIILSFCLLDNPLFGASFIVTLTGITVIFAGIAWVALAIRLRALKKLIE